MRKNIRLSKISAYLSFIAGALMVVFLLKLDVRENIDTALVESPEEIVYIDDYISREVKNDDAPIGIIKEYTFNIDENISDNVYIGFYTIHQYVDVFLDGEKIYYLKQSDKSLTKTVGSNWTLIPLSREDAGKEIRVELQPVYDNLQDDKVEFLLGPKLSIHKQEWKRCSMQVIMSVLLIAVGFLYVWISVFHYFRKEKGKRIIMAGLLSIMIGVGRITDASFLHFVYPEKTVELFYVSVAMLMVGPIVLAKYLRAKFESKIRRLLDIYCIWASALCVVQIGLQILNIMDIRESLLCTHITMAGGACIVIVGMYLEYLKLPDKSMISQNIEIPIICILGVMADVIAYYVQDSSSGLMFSLMSVLVYMIYKGFEWVIEYTEQEKRLAEKEKELAESRISLMISQIRPHFLYNVISAIRELCRQEPEKARDALGYFATYLRGNMDSLETKELIHFSKELKHIETYLELESLRFEDKLYVIYEIDEDNFYLPALSVQPLVENAVKHGVCKMEDGGTIIIRTRRDGDYIRISVIDDGMGFDPENIEYMKDGRSHLGIKNVKDRLKEMVGGELNIYSIPNQGTEAAITFQIKRGE